MLKKIKNLIFNNYSTDIAFRYLPIVDYIKKENYINKKILEVGSGDLGITPYLKKEIIGLDVCFIDKKTKYLKKVYYNGFTFPFNDNSFDVVINVDALEHIPKNNRANFINEIFRVVKKSVIIMAPCGNISYEHDKKVNKYFYKIHKTNDKYLDDHINNKLPEKEDVIKMIKNSANKQSKKIEIKTAKQLNIYFRLFIMKLKISKNPILNILYYLLIILIPFRKMLNFGNCYRELFIIKII